MSRIAADIALLQRAADTAGLVLYPGGGNKTFTHGNITVAPDTLTALALELDERRRQVPEYRVIDYPAVWLLHAAQQLLLHRADDNAVMAERYQRLGEHLRSAVESDLENARKSLGEVP